MAGIVDEYPYQASYPGAGSGYFTGTCPTTAEEISSEWDSRTMANKYELKDITHHLYQTLPTQVSPPLAALRSLLHVVRSFTRAVRSPRGLPPLHSFRAHSSLPLLFLKYSTAKMRRSATCARRRANRGARVTSRLARHGAIGAADAWIAISALSPWRTVLHAAK